METVIRDCLNYIELHIEETLSVEEVAREFGYSKHHFSRLFSSSVGMSLKAYKVKAKLVKSAKDIISGSTVLDAAVSVGYETHTGYNKAFKKHFGYTPKMLLAARLTRDLYSLQGGKVMTHEKLYQEIISELGNKIDQKALDRVEQAYEFGLKAHEGQKRYSGEDYVTHPLYVAMILIKMGANVETVILGILHDCNESDSKVNLEDLQAVFGEIVYNKLTRINQLNITPDLLKQVNLSEEEDVILVKLADRLHNMSTLKYLKPDRWQVKAAETLAIFSPIADDLGYVDMKANLDRLSVDVL